MRSNCIHRGYYFLSPVVFINIIRKNHLMWFCFVHFRIYYEIVMSLFRISRRNFVLSYESFPSPKYNGIPLFILHGLLGSKQNWRSIARNIAKQGTAVVTVDLRNHGESTHESTMSYEEMSEDLIETIKHLGHNDGVNICGHSVGGKVAMFTALRNPEMVRKLVIVDILPSTEESAGAPFIRKILMIMKSFEIEKKNATSFIEAKNMAFYHIQSKVQNEAVRNWILTNLIWNKENGNLAWRCNLTAILSSLPLAVSFPTVINYKPFQKPVLFVKGENSQHMKYESITYFPV